MVSPSQRITQRMRRRNRKWTPSLRADLLPVLHLLGSRELSPMWVTPEVQIPTAPCPCKSTCRRLQTCWTACQLCHPFDFILQKTLLKVLFCSRHHAGASMESVWNNLLRFYFVENICSLFQLEFGTFQPQEIGVWKPNLPTPGKIAPGSFRDLHPIITHHQPSLNKIDPAASSWN